MYMVIKKGFVLGAVIGAAAGAACACLGWMAHEVMDFAGFGAFLAGEAAGSEDECCRDCDGCCGFCDGGDSDDDAAPATGFGIPVMIVSVFGGVPDGSSEDSAGEDECVDVPDGKDDPAEVAWI